MAFFLVKRISKGGSVDILLVSSTTKPMAEKTMKCIYPDCEIEVPHEEYVLNEQLFNEQYGGIAVLQSV